MSLPHPAAALGNQGGPSVTLLPNQWNQSVCTMLCSLLLLALLLGAALPQPVHQRDSYSVPEDFSAPLELPQKHFGLVDDYGIEPKQPRLRSRAAAKSERDGLDVLQHFEGGSL